MLMLWKGKIPNDYEVSAYKKIYGDLVYCVPHYRRHLPKGWGVLMGNKFYIIGENKWTKLK